MSKIAAEDAFLSEFRAFIWGYISGTRDFPQQRRVTQASKGPYKPETIITSIETKVRCLV